MVYGVLGVSRLFLNRPSGNRFRISGLSIYGSGIEMCSGSEQALHLMLIDLFSLNSRGESDTEEEEEVQVLGFRI